MYTIKEASARSGVGIPLLRAWERRYGVVRPTRTASGYRLYDDDAIERLRAMRHLIATGWSAQQAAGRVRDASPTELAALPAGSAALADPAAGEATASQDLAGGPTDLVLRLVDGARQIDATGLDAALDEAFAMARFEVVVERVVMPALRAIGDAWASGDVSVAGEHAASHAVLRRLSMAYEAAADREAERPVLVGLGPGARHELGALAFAVTARRAGLPVLYLGPDLPVDDWVSAATERDAPAAVVAVPTRTDVRHAAEVLTALGAARFGMVRAVGGDQAARAALDPAVTVLPPSIPDAVAALRLAMNGGG